MAELAALVRRSANFHELSDELLGNVLDLLAGRYPERGVLRAAAADRVGPRQRHASAPATAPSGWRSRAAARSPIAGCSACSSPTAHGSASSTRRWCTRAVPATPSCSARPHGGSRTSRSSGSRSRPAPGVPAKMPFWHGDRPGRPLELGRALGAFVREIRSLPARAGAANGSTEHYALDPLAASQRRPVPRRAGGRHGRRARRHARSSSSASATRSATGGCAC